MQQQRMLEQFVQRLDHLEEVLKAMQEKRSQRSMFGGFLGPMGLL